jgi:hypothetical protein
MTADLTLRLGLGPGMRLLLWGFETDFGALPTELWQVPGAVPLLASGALRLTVPAPWGALAAAGPADDGVIELVRQERPGERERMPAVGSGSGSAGAGARLLVRLELPDGAGASTVGAADTAITMALASVDPCGPSGLSDWLPSPGGSHAVLDGEPVPCDLAGAGLVLALIDTRVRRAPRPPRIEDSPVATAAQAIAAGDFELLGTLLTAAHLTLPADGEQLAAVSASLEAGALGARAIADGPGRPVCALVPAERVTALRIAVLNEFARAGYRAPRILTFLPSGEPTRLPLV